jgi:hypothetical protein
MTNRKRQHPLHAFMILWSHLRYLPDFRLLCDQVVNKQAVHSDTTPLDLEGTYQYSASHPLASPQAAAFSHDLAKPFNDNVIASKDRIEIFGPILHQDHATGKIRHEVMRTADRIFARMRKPNLSL